MKPKTPSHRAVAAELAAAQSLWDAVIATLAGTYGAIDREWKPSKSTFGWMCLLKHKKKTLLYMTPEKDMFRIAIVLGERAAALALASGLPEGIKALIREARPYTEGRGIRFPVVSAADVSVVGQLVAIKLAPKK